MLDRKAQSINLEDIDVTEPFWKRYMEMIRTISIPYQLDALNDRVEGATKSHCIDNFRIAAGMMPGKFEGMVFQDSDAYKWLEAVAYSLMWHPDADLEKEADNIIDIISAAQQPDGYLDTYYIINGLDKRFTNLMDHHELYCLGHMIQAAIPYYKATGKNKFLITAERYALCVFENIGIEENKIHGYPGHEVVEMALIDLYRLTGDERYKDLASYFIDQRGHAPLYFESERKKNGNKCNWDDSYFKYQYYQAGKPVRQQKVAEGHAVRAVYLYSGMADVASATEDQELFETCKRLWNNIVSKQMYVTGSIGASEHGESFTFDYDLPNDTTYSETCASVGLIFFAKRMFDLTLDGRYLDVMEQTLYNSAISGIALDGQHYFYVNPLEVNPESSLKDYHKKHVEVSRLKWFGCSCCPTNIARLLTSIGGYAFEQNEDTFFINLLIGGKVQGNINGIKQTLKIETNYPWNGEARIVVDKAEGDTRQEYTLAVRIPGWCRNYKVTVSGEGAGEVHNGICYIRKVWKPGDVVELKLDMPVRIVHANPRVRADIGKVAVVRGPLVYCLEEADNGKQLQELFLKDQPDFDVAYEGNFLEGICSITGKGRKLSEKKWEGALYLDDIEETYEEKRLTFIPYYAWANREPGEMTVWVHRK
jgi:DUF1680 family protein